MIVTAGAIDCHVHFICPQLVYEAVSSGKGVAWLHTLYSHSIEYGLVHLRVLETATSDTRRKFMFVSSLLVQRHVVERLVAEHVRLSIAGSATSLGN